MSRLIVKGLPKRYDERLLREMFSSSGVVTDAKILRTADGRSRQFGFVGFRTEEDAQRARKCFDHTYVDTSHISVQLARPVGDNDIPRPWSKYSKGSSKHDGRKGREAKDNDESRDPTAKKTGTAMVSKDDFRVNKKSSDPELEEFKSVVAKRSRTPLWSDGNVHVTVKKSSVPSRKFGGDGILLERSHVVFGDALEDSDEGEDDLYEEIPRESNMGGLSEQADESLVEPVDEDSQQNTEGVDAADDNVDDLTYFRSKVSKILDDNAETDRAGTDHVGKDEGEEFDQERNEHHKPSAVCDEKTPDQTTQDTGASDIVVVPAHPENRKVYESNGDSSADVSDTGRLFIRNLAFSVTEDELELLFEPYGAISDIHIVQDLRTKASKGVAFVLFVIPENAVRAMTALDGTIYCGRLLHILPAKPRPESTGGLPAMAGMAVGSNRFKMERELARKESAKSGSDATAYNALFMSTNSVADVMADRYGVGKSDIYGAERGESGTAAVRLAAIEAKLQAETKDFMLENGIDMQLAQEASRDIRKKKLSRTAFLVKNLPTRISRTELEDLFSKFGEIDRLLIAPTGLVAVAIFHSANDAKKAYLSLAYSRLKEAPLYLEWLPAAAMVESAGCKPTEHAFSKTEDDVSTERKSLEEAAEEVDGDRLASAPRLSVFVKNLNFDTSDDGLRKHFVKVLRKRPQLVQSIRTATVSKRTNPKDPNGPRLSYGYGFIEFASERDAEEAVKVVQGSTLDGHVLELRIANQSRNNTELKKVEKARKRSASNSSKQKVSNKLLVRNIAFEATARDMRELFGTFGQLKSLRMPKKQDGTHRGFGFLEFVSKNEATLAMKSLSTTHLYGRHLVIEYAGDSEDGHNSLELLQNKAAIQVAKRRRIDLIVGVGTANKSAVVEDDDHQQMLDEMFA